MTRAKDISKIVTDANLSGTLDVTGTVTTGGNVGIGTSSPSLSTASGSASGLEINGTVPAINLKESSGNDEFLLYGGASSATIYTVNNLRFLMSGSEKMRLTTGGNVGIGVTSTSSKLHVNSEMSIGADGDNRAIVGYTPSRFYIGTRQSGTNYFNTISVTSGNVGIGINSPASLLHLKSSTVDARLQLTNSASADDTTNSGASLQLFNDDLYINAVENSGNIIFRTDGGGGFVERMRIFSNGHVSVGTTDNTYGFNVGGSGSDVRGKFQGSNQYRLGLQNGTNDIVWLGSGGANNFRISNSAGATKLTIDSNGNLLVGRTDNPSGVSNCIYALGNYGVTTGSGANVFINSEGLFFRSTSSLRYKNTINDATHGLTELLTLRPVTYKGNNDGDTVYGGLIAEEVHDAGLTEFVQYNDDGEPDALAYGNMVSLCIKAIQELKAELDSAKARITALENGE